MIEIKGVNYDVGVPPGSGINLPVSKMKEEIDIIKNELHCNAVRIYGRDLEKLVECAEIAADYGLMVWFSPRLINSTLHETIEYIKECSFAAEELRRNFPAFVFVLGNEFSLDLKGFVEGETTYERIIKLSRPLSILKNSIGAGFHNKLNIFLSEALSTARQNFKGEITYASGQWERVNWENFDIISLNYYRNSFNKLIYKIVIKKYTGRKKKFAVTEFGCCSYKGADKKGAWGYSIVDWKQPKPMLRKMCTRDEDIQAKYLLELLHLYQKENVYAAFVYTFVARKALFNPNPEYDLDMVNFGIIKVIPSENQASSYLWEKKKAFEEISKFFMPD